MKAISIKTCLLVTTVFTGVAMIAPASAQTTTDAPTAQNEPAFPKWRGV